MVVLGDDAFLGRRVVGELLRSSHWSAGFQIPKPWASVLVRQKRYGRPLGAEAPGARPSPRWVWQCTRPSDLIRQSPSLVRLQTGQGCALLLGVKSVTAASLQAVDQIQGREQFAACVDAVAAGDQAVLVPLLVAELQAAAAVGLADRLGADAL